MVPGWTPYNPIAQSMAVPPSPDPAVAMQLQQLRTQLEFETARAAIAKAHLDPFLLGIPGPKNCNW